MKVRVSMVRNEKTDEMCERGVCEMGYLSSIPVYVVELVDFGQAALLEHGGGGAVDGGEDAEALEEVGIHGWD